MWTTHCAAAIGTFMNNFKNKVIHFYKYFVNKVCDNKYMKKLKQLFVFLKAPLVLLNHEGTFYIWPVFMIICGLVPCVVCVFNGNYKQVFVDGSFYTYAIGILMPLIFDALISFVISKRSRRSKMSFVQLKAVYILFAFLIVLISSIAYGSVAKASIWLQIIIFLATSIIAFLLYLCIHMTEFHTFVKDYDDKDYYIEQKSIINKLNDFVIEKKVDGDGVKL